MWQEQQKGNKPISRQRGRQRCNMDPLPSGHQPTCLPQLDGTTLHQCLPLFMGEPLYG